MPSFTAHAYNLVFRLMKKPEVPDYPEERRVNAARKVPKVPAGVTLKEYDWGETLTKDGNDKGWVFYIHGGGFTVGTARERRGITQHITACRAYNVVSINYRLAPENRWPAQLDDCHAAWRYCTEELGIDPAKTVLMGESAGGTLVLSLALYLKEHGETQPKAIVAFSPGTNNAEHYPSHSENIKTDYMLWDLVLKGLAGPLFGKDVPEEELRKPTLSPIYGDFTGLPPVFLSASDTEVLLDDSGQLYEKLKKEGHPTELDIQHGVCHAFQIFPQMPEAKRSLRKAFAFIENCRTGS